MAKTDSYGECRLTCKDCPLSVENNGHRITCVQLQILYPEEYEKILEQWDKEHPRKTRQQDFFEKYPNAPTTFIYNAKMPYPRTCAKDIGYCDDCISNCEKCWEKPLEE